MRTLTLNDGTLYEVDWCNGDKGVLYANVITDKDFIAIATDFSDSAKTSTIMVSFGEENSITYEGFTQLVSISFDDWRSGTVMITLRQPPANEEGA